MDRLRIVSKANPLDKKYIPMGLMYEPIANTWIMEEAYYQFYELNRELQKNGFSSLKIVSGYRSYEYQKMLYNKTFKQTLYQRRDRQVALEETEKLITPPGWSEHQLGLAIDVSVAALDTEDYPIDTFEQTQQMRWMLKRSSDYGFVLRYPRHKVAVTGIKYKPYHYRYVGINHAKKMKRLDLCLEEYIVHQNQLRY
ncbi:MAG: M15 family metallopeptidase [Cellulosilyticaceae bacterium]